MTRQKHNEYLDISSSDEIENSGYDSGAAEDAKFSRTAQVSSHQSKRQKLYGEPTSASDDLDFASDGNLLDPKTQSIQAENKTHRPPTPSAKQSYSNPTSPQIQESISSPPTETDASQIPTPNQTLDAKSRKKPLTASSLATTNAIAKKAGVLYLSRIPPFMRPSTVRSLLSVYGPITRLFLTPEPPSSYLARRARGGNRKKSFIDGWVEFARKRHARVCADAINARTIGGRGGRFYGDDVWNARYLRGFAWGDLMADVRGEEREREERIRVGVGREVRERKTFLRQVEKSKIEETRRKKAEMRRGGITNVDSDNDNTTTPLTQNPPQPIHKINHKINTENKNNTIDPSTKSPPHTSNPPPPHHYPRFRQTRRIGGASGVSGGSGANGGNGVSGSNHTSNKDDKSESAERKFYNDGVDVKNRVLRKIF